MLKDSKKVWCAIHQKVKPQSMESCHHSGQAPACIIASRKEIFGTMFNHVTSLIPGWIKKKKLPETHTSSLSPELPPSVASTITAIPITFIQPQSLELQDELKNAMPIAAGGSPSVDMMPDAGMGIDIDLHLDASTEGSDGGTSADAWDAIDIDHAQQHVWSNQTPLGTATVEDYKSNDENHNEDYDDAEDEEDGFDSKSEEGKEYDDGLPPEDMINEDFKCKLAEIGFCITNMISYSRTAIR
ncbi:hypothetical protein L208DRAFT_1379888 [Tricholoma matsutake]|nr:hypothetical protein L208DRAFT_1379888 [Tricholoma matsutake 945]